MFHSNLKLSTQCILIVNTFPKFYQQLLHLRSKVSEKESLTASELFREVLSSNSRIMSNEESLYKVHSLSSGKVPATPILKSVSLQFSPFIL